MECCGGNRLTHVSIYFSQIMLRFLMWNVVVAIDSHKVGLGWKLLFNFTYYTGVLANWTLVWLAAERLVSVAWPDQVKIYLTDMRARLNLFLQVGSNLDLTYLTFFFLKMGTLSLGSYIYTKYMKDVISKSSSHHALAT